MDATAQHADLEAHHIEGIAREGNVPFDVPLISHIVGDLWTGGCIGGARLPDDFVHVVSLYPWEHYVLGEDTTRSEYKLYDSRDVPTGTIHEIADEVVDSLEAGKTLVHCQAGLNRSNLVAGLALVKLGMTPDQAITLIRDRRSPAALCNQTFEHWLRVQAGCSKRDDGQGVPANG